MQQHDSRTLHDRIFSRRPARERIESTTRHVNDAADMTVRAIRPAATPDTFADRAIREAQAMDALQAKHDRLLEEYQAAITEVGILRGRVDDLEDHVDKVNAYWEHQYEQASLRTQRITRAYAALESRFNGAIDYLANALKQSKAEAYAPVQPEQVGDPPHAEVIEEPTDTDDEQAGRLPIFLTSQTLPDNRLNPN
jgi:hypothetical protein